MQDVAVAGEYQRLDFALLRLPAKRSENVVGLEAFHLQDGHLEGLNKLAHPPELAPKLRWRGRAMRLVLRKSLVPESGRRDIEGDDAVSGMPLVQRSEQRVEEAVNGCDLFAGGAHVERVPEGVKGPVYQGVSVQQD